MADDEETPKEDEPEGGVELDEEIKKAQALAVSLTNFSTNHSPFPPTRHPPPCRQQKRGTQKSSKAKPISTKMSLTTAIWLRWSWKPDRYRFTTMA